jgi:chaperone modulatory protein CbpM
MSSMNSSDSGVVDAIIVEDEVSFTFTQLCQASSSNAAQLRELVNEGILRPQGLGPQDWVFDGTALFTSRTALRLGSELQLGSEAAALVLDLLAEIETLRSRLRRAGLL